MRALQGSAWKIRQLQSDSIGGFFHERSEICSKEPPHTNYRRIDLQTGFTPMKNRFLLTLTVFAAFFSSAKPTGAAPGDSPSPTHETREIAGWNVHINSNLLTNNADTTAAALKLLSAQLDNIVGVMPPAAIVELRKVPLWISPEYSGIRPRAEYHASPNWLRENGRDPRMAKGVEFTNIRIFEAENRRMPMLALHELAHAYHDRVLGNQHPEIKAAYEAAKASGKYDLVEQRSADGRSRKTRAYAMNNPQEYFAESTEAFFGRNDFFPFTREELKETDPQMCALLEKLWSTPQK